jgi:hypothetical protein
MSIMAPEPISAVYLVNASISLYAYVAKQRLGEIVNASPNNTRKSSRIDGRFISWQN